MNTIKPCLFLSCMVVCLRPSHQHQRRTKVYEYPKTYPVSPSTIKSHWHYDRCAGLRANASRLRTPAAAPASSGEAAAPAADTAKALELWTFVNTHARWFRSMAEDYTKEKDPDFALNVSEIAYGDMHDKTLIALQSGGVGAPDLVDIEQGRFGGFLRGEDPGLVDLADRLNEGGYLEQLRGSAGSALQLPGQNLWH